MERFYQYLPTLVHRLDRTAHGESRERRRKLVTGCEAERSGERKPAGGPVGGPVGGHREEKMGLKFPRKQKI